MTQDQEILEALKDGDELTALDALNRFNCFRLAAVINRLRKEHDIETVMITNGKKHYASYRLKQEPKQGQLIS